MKHASLSLDYFALAKEAKALNTSGAAKVIRIAFLAPDLPEDPSLYLQTLAGLNLFETASLSEGGRPISVRSPA